MITCKVEKFDEALPRIQTLIDAQWNEVGSHRDRFTRHVHWEDYRALEQARRLITITASSETDPIVGYMFGVLAWDMHRNSLSQPDKRVMTFGALAYWMLPKYRGYARTLFHFIERHVLETYNAQQIHIRVKPDANEAGAFLTLLGYRVGEVSYTRLLGEASDARFAERAGKLEPAVD